MLDLGFDESSDSVPLHIDNTSALHVAGNRTYSLHVKYIALRCTRTNNPPSKHIALRYNFFVRKLVEGGKVSIHYVKSLDRLVELGTVASAATTTSSGSSTSLRLEQHAHHLPREGHCLSAQESTCVLLTSFGAL